MNAEDARLQLAHGGLHPDRVRDLIAERGSAAAVVRAIGTGSVRTTDRVRAAVAVTPLTEIPQGCSLKFLTLGRV